MTPDVRRTDGIPPIHLIVPNMIPKVFVPVAAALAFSLPAFAATEQRTADLIVVNGGIITMDARDSRATAVAIRDGVFVAVGSDAEIQRWAAPNTRVVNAKGHMVIPGLIETHVHATGAARGEAQQPFRQLHSLSEIQDWVRERAKELTPGSWITLPRVDVTRIRERRLPNRLDLDTAAPLHPAVFTWQYANRTVQVLNSAALAAAKITKDTRPPPGGKIHHRADGEPTGVMDDCKALLTPFLPGRNVPEEKYHDSLVKLLRLYSEIGITSITDRNTDAAGYRTYQKLKAQDRLPVRVTVTIGLSTNGSVAGTEKAIQALPFKTGDGDDWVRVGPLKIGVDGGVLYGTAHMREPYGPKSFSLYGISDPAYRGDLRVTRENLKNIIRTGHRLGWQMSSHVTGDAGVDAVLEAVEAADADSPMAPRRYNFIHAYFPDRKTALRMARVGACVDTQPAWYYKDGDALADALSPQRLANFIGVKTWQDAGVKVALNSDHMQGFDPDTSLNPYNPFLAIQTAVTRKTEGGKVFGPEERITRHDALRMVTLDAAWLSFDEVRKGSIEVGKLADVSVLTENLFTCPEDQIHRIRSQVTIVGGKIVWEKPTSL
ncbi:MAG: N-substituted formamide deformylase precursor [Verrucomicrobiota bacterium]|jgi:predicted amidohydrolase YtcJ